MAQIGRPMFQSFDLLMPKSRFFLMETFISSSKISNFWKKNDHIVFMIISVLMIKCINLYISGIVSMSYYLNISYWSFESFRLRSKIIFSVKGESGEVKQAVKLTVLEISGINLSLTASQSIQLDPQGVTDWPMCPCPYNMRGSHQFTVRMARHTT